MTEATRDPVAAHMELVMGYANAIHARAVGVGGSSACFDGYAAVEVSARALAGKAVQPDLADAWCKLYRRAISEANGLTNYVEDRPELRRAEKNLNAIEALARALETHPAATQGDAQ